MGGGRGGEVGRSGVVEEWCSGRVGGRGGEVGEWEEG